jgi:hypothetical protein
MLGEVRPTFDLKTLVSNQMFGNASIERFGHTYDSRSNESLRQCHQVRYILYAMFLNRTSTDDKIVRGVL